MTETNIVTAEAKRSPVQWLKDQLARPMVAQVLVLAALMMVLHRVVRVVGDDLPVMAEVRVYGFTEWFLDNLHGWSTRLLVDQVIWVVAHDFRIWRILNVAVFILFYVFLVKVFRLDRSRWMLWLALAMTLIFPFEFMGTAGFMVTSMTYLWPSAFALVAAYGMRKIVTEQRVRWWEYPLYLVSFVYAANQEQSNLLLIGALAGLLINWLVTRRRLQGFLCTLFVIGSAMMVFVFVSPGAGVRTYSETGAWFPDFLALDTMARIQEAYGPTFARIFASPNWLFLALAGMLFWRVWQRHSAVYFRVIAAIPLISVVALGFLRPVTGMYFGALDRLTDGRANVQVETYEMMSSYFAIVLFGFIFACLIVSAYLAFAPEEHWLGLLSGLLITLGFATRVAVGFSPTVHASGLRTFTFTYLAMIYVLFLAAQALRRDNPRLERPLLVGFLLLGGFSYLQALALQMW